MTSLEAEDTFTSTGEELGRGSTGRICKVTNRNGEPFARKETIISSGLREKGSGRSWVERQNQIWKPLQHENVIRLKHARERIGDEERSYGVVDVYMEHAGHGSVSSLCEHRRNVGKCLSEDEIQGVGKDVAKGLEYLHEERLVHGNLKCSNILLVADGDRQLAKISDFASAAMAGRKVPREFRRHPFTTTLQERGFWTAPEVLKPTYTSSQAADVYSYGATLLEMYISTQCDLYRDELETFGQISRGGSPSLLLDSHALYASPWAKDLIRVCLDPDPAERLTAKEVLEHPFIVGAPHDTNGGNSSGILWWRCTDCGNNGANAEE